MVTEHPERLGFRDLIGQSPVMRQVYDLLARVSASMAPVLILGESGTGKEMVARALHDGGPRARAPFVAVHCGALPEALLDGELFGDVQGAGASDQGRGRFVEADGGTLLLDEIAAVPPALQPKLLRAIEAGAVRPVGGGPERPVDVRIVAATRQDLARAVAEKRFREDLYYRLDVIPVHVPPLRARREDIPLLIDHFVTRYRERHPEVQAREVAPEVMRWLIEQPWPGNVRELENAVERLLLLARGRRIDLRDLSHVLPEPLPETMAALTDEIVPMRVMMRRYLEWVLVQTGGNKVRAAELLGIDVSTIYRTLARDRPQGG